MEQPPPSVIRRLLASLAENFVPENFMQARRLISHSDEDAASCGRCEKDNAVGGCGLCFACANTALSEILNPNSIP